MKGDVRIKSILKLLNKGDSLMRSLFEQKRFCGLISKCIAGSLLVGGIATVNAQTSDEAIEEVIVTGIRASLQDAIAKKRNADDIRDKIYTYKKHPVVEQIKQECQRIRTLHRI